MALNGKTEVRDRWPGGLVCCRGGKEEKVGAEWGCGRREEARGRKEGKKVERSGEASGDRRRKEKD